MGSSSGRRWGNKLARNVASWAGEFGEMALPLRRASGPGKTQGSLFRMQFCPEDRGTSGFQAMFEMRVCVDDPAI